MIGAIVSTEVRLRARAAAGGAAGLLLLTAIVGGLYPSLGDSIGKLALPQGVGGLVGGSDFSTIAGWLRTEVTSIYGPLVFAGLAIMGAAAATAGEEENHVLAVVLAQPVPRRTFLLGKALALASVLAGLAVVVFAGMLLAVALAGGGIDAAHLAAAAVHLLFLALAVGALALAVGAASGRRGLATGIPAAVTVAMYLINGLAPSLPAIDWLKYLTLFHWYEHEDPLTGGIDPTGLAVLAVVAGVLLTAGLAAFERRDLRG